MERAQKVISLLSPLEHAIIFCPLLAFLLLVRLPGGLRRPIEQGGLALGGLALLLAIALPGGAAARGAVASPGGLCAGRSFAPRPQPFALPEANAAATREGQTLDPTTLLPTGDGAAGADR